jgi:hypothetical protein
VKGPKHNRLGTRGELIVVWLVLGAIVAWLVLG